LNQLDEIGLYTLLARRDGHRVFEGRNEDKFISMNVDMKSEKCYKIRIQVPMLLFVTTVDARFWHMPVIGPD
jgi:hypothetical protein